MELAEVGRVASRVVDEVEKAVVGKREALELLMLELPNALVCMLEPCRPQTWNSFDAQRMLRR